MLLVSISQGSLWHYLPLKSKNPDTLRLEWERGWGEFGAAFSISWDKYLENLYLERFRHKNLARLPQVRALDTGKA